jgi:hypothetical protein
MHGYAAEQNPGSDLSTRPAPTATPEQPRLRPPFGFCRCRRRVLFKEV